MDAQDIDIGYQEGLAREATAGLISTTTIDRDNRSPALATSWA
jgi:hypothetical protein